MAKLYNTLMQKKLLVICGPTATGKTKLAIRLAKKFGGELVSADSRQVYKGMDIGTGKDLPSNTRFKIYNLRFKKNTKENHIKKKYNIGYYEIDGVRIWGYDLVDPIESFSVGQYVQIARKIIKDIHSREKLPILVGGTGLYIKAVVDGLDTIGISQDIELRIGLSQKSIAELQEILRGEDPVKLASLNNSDLNNPLRLVRAIEIAQSHKKNILRKSTNYDCLFVGLKMTNENLYTAIKKRVEKRLSAGQRGEIKTLIENNVSWGMQSMSSIGYGLWKEYFEQKIDLDQIEKEWIQAEKHYAKKQMTWFKRDKRINWFDASLNNYQKDIETKVKRWHNT